MDPEKSLLDTSEALEPVCTCVSKRGHWRKLRDGSNHWFQDRFCGDKAFVTAYNPLTTEVYHVCKRHWDDEALHAADRMGLKYRRVEK